jgi:hypothetical protein
MATHRLQEIKYKKASIVQKMADPSKINIGLSLCKEAYWVIKRGSSWGSSN